MNLARELNKPVALTSDGSPITLQQLQKVGALNFSMCNEAVLTRSTGMKIGYLAKAASFAGDFDQRRRLTLARLKSSVGEKFEFLDGKVFTAEQAASEVEKGTEVGRYFINVENRAAEIARTEAAKL